ncbi:uncharacterized protein LOC120360031, partial [Solenopsis invicta]|uniref:uncharacterized protein LOC120360031 n=1 Tax=Solenopsis invicta TaxID=13686 RepID=UPI00193EBA3E
MPDCYAKDCKSRYGENRKNQFQLQWEHTHGIKISFHRIPTNLEKRKQWLDEMQLNNSEIPKNATFCSLHFQETNLGVYHRLVFYSCTRLHWNVPSCFHDAQDCAQNTRERYKKKILQQKQQKSTKRIATLKEILKSLKQKNLLNAEQVD